MSTTSLRENWYLLTFLDNWCRMYWGYFLKKKLEAFEYFKFFKALIENEIGERVQTLRTDNGREYTYNEFKRFCDTHGIRR